MANCIDLEMLDIRSIITQLIDAFWCLWAAIVVNDNDVFLQQSTVTASVVDL